MEPIAQFSEKIILMANEVTGDAIRIINREPEKTFDVVKMFLKSFRKIFGDNLSYSEKKILSALLCTARAGITDKETVALYDKTLEKFQGEK